LCTLLGTIEARVKAAQQFLTRLEELAGSGAGPATPAPEVDRAPSQQEAYVQPPQHIERQPVQASPPAPLPRREEPQARLESAGNPNDDPWSRNDPWGGGSQGRQTPATRASQASPVQEPSLGSRGSMPDDPWSAPAPRADLPQKMTTFKEPEVITYNPERHDEPVVTPSTTSRSFGAASNSIGATQHASSNSTDVSRVESQQ